MPGWLNGKDTALDVSEVSPLQFQLVKKASEETGSAARKRYKEKTTKFSEACKREGIEFFPLVVETFGGWDPNSLVILDRISRQLAAHTGVPNEETSRHFYQRLGILLAKGNAALLLRRRPDDSDPVIDVDLDFDT